MVACKSCERGVFARFKRVDNRHIKVVQMKIVVSLLLFGIFSLPFLHDHGIQLAKAGYGSQDSEQSGLVRHVHLTENSSHLPKTESAEHQSQEPWPFLDHVTLLTLASGSSPHIFAILPSFDSSPRDYQAPSFHQSMWEPTSPVRGSPLIDSDTFLPSSNLPPFHSGRAPPLSSL
jgi:hypothetical protein